MRGTVYPSFSREMQGRVVMPGYMNVAVTVTLEVDRNYPDILRVQVAHSDLFHHKFTSNMRQLKDGRTARMAARESTISPVAGNRVAIQAQTWHWQHPVEVPLSDVDEFLDEAEFFLCQPR